MRTLADYDAQLICETATAILHPQREVGRQLASIYGYFLKCYQRRVPVAKPTDELYDPYVALVGSRADAKTRAELSAHLAYQVAQGNSLEEIIRSQGLITELGKQELPSSAPSSTTPTAGLSQTAVDAVVDQPPPPPTPENITTVSSTRASSVTKPVNQPPKPSVYRLWDWGYVAKSLLISFLLVPIVPSWLLHLDSTTSGMSVAASLLIASLIRV